MSVEFMGWAGRAPLVPGGGITRGKPEGRPVDTDFVSPGVDAGMVGEAEVGASTIELGT